MLMVRRFVTRSVQSADTSREKFRRNFAAVPEARGPAATRDPTCKKTSVSFRAPA
jgi:hypothetical protein